MSKNSVLSDKDVSVIATQTGIDPDIIRAWHKGDKSLLYPFIIRFFSCAFKFYFQIFSKNALMVK